MIFYDYRFEVTFGADENSRIKMAMSTMPRNKRDTRSAIFGFSSPDFGDFDFELSQGIKEIVVKMNVLVIENLDIFY